MDRECHSPSGEAVHFEIEEEAQEAVQATSSHNQPYHNGLPGSPVKISMGPAVYDDEIVCLAEEMNGGAVGGGGAEAGTGGYIFQHAESIDYGVKPPKLICDDRYLVGEVLGQGTYGKVKEVLDMVTLERMAVKIMSSQKLRKIPNGEKNAENEYRLMRRLRHRNVVRVYNLLSRRAEPSGNVDKLYLLMEYCACGLYEMLENAPDRKLPSWQAHKYFCDLINGLEYLHSQRIIHKDIKPQNLLISNNELLKIADFGVAEEIGMFSEDDTITSSQGTPMFQPPEVARGEHSFPGFKLDIWCAGITLYNITTASYPFQGATVFMLLENISTQEVRVPEDLSPHLRSLLLLMLAKDPAERVGIPEIKQHHWFTQKHCVTPERVPLPVRADNPHKAYTEIVFHLERLHNMSDGAGAEMEAGAMYSDQSRPAVRGESPFETITACQIQPSSPKPPRPSSSSPAAGAAQLSDPAIKPAAKHKKKVCAVM